MALRFHWFLPTNGNGRDIVGGGHGLATGTAGAIRPASLAYLGQIARSAEQLGFEGALTPTGAWCEDAWLAIAMLTEVTENMMSFASAARARPVPDEAPRQAVS
jgi:alkanesulfonate monooxygenase